MATVRTIQRRFTQGEIDPKMIGRHDIDQYGGACAEMTNVLVLPQGGFKRRPGLEYLDKNLGTLTFLTGHTVTAPNGGTASNGNDRSSATAVTTTNNISTTNPYVVYHHDLGSAKTIGVVYIFGFSLSAGSSSEFYVQVSADNSAWTTVGAALSVTTTATNFSRRVEASYRYVRLARVGSTDLGTAKATITDMNVYEMGAVGNSRLINFEFSTTQNYVIVATDQNLAIYDDGVHQLDVYVQTMTNARLPEINWVQSADTLIIFHEAINPIEVQRNGADDNWLQSNLAFDTIPNHAFTETTQTGAAASMGTLTPSATTGTITLTLGSGTWPSGKENQYVEGNGGRARILSAQSGTVVNAFVEIPFYNTSAIAATDWNYLTGYEAVWSSTRGWPICGTFHQGRLWIGGSRDRPTTLWGSRVGLYYDFDLGTALDDEAIEITLDADQLNHIVNLYSGRSLMVFTTGAEFIFPQSLNEPITPSNVAVLRQTRVGSEDGLKVAETEGGVFYIQSGGKSLQEFVYSDTQQAFSNNVISLLSGHLIEGPEDFTLRRATSLDDAALLAVVRTDGGLTIGTIQSSQGIAAFTDHSTDGTFKACGVDYNDLYFVVRRTINGATVDYLERFNEDHLLDSSLITDSGLPTATFSVAHLEAETVSVVADGSVLSDETVASGSVTIDRNATTSCEIGLSFTPTVTDLPVEVADLGTALGKLMNISEVVVRLYQTQHCKINGKAIQFRGFGLSGGGSPLDSPPPSFTGVKRLLGFRGWDNAAQVTITQDDPAPMTVLELSKRVSLDG